MSLWRGPIIVVVCSIRTRHQSPTTLVLSRGRVAQDIDHSIVRGSRRFLIVGWSRLPNSGQLGPIIFLAHFARIVNFIWSTYTLKFWHQVSKLSLPSLSRVPRGVNAA